MKLNTILLIVLVILVVILIYQNNQNQENLDSTLLPLSNESIQNIASVYNNQDMKVTNLKVTGSFNMIPRGCIIAFNDQKAPDGWALCDGGEYVAPNGDKVRTPDLRGRFIRMSYNRISASVWGDILPINVKEEKDSYGTSSLLHNSWSGDNKTFETAMMNHNFGEYGGSDWRVQSVNQLPSHTHKENYVTKHNIEGGCGVNQNPALPYGWESGGGCAYNKLGDTSATGSNWGMGIIPPYYVLTYIMKL